MTDRTATAYLRITGGWFHQRLRLSIFLSAARFIIRKTGPECRPEPVLDVAMVVRSAVVHQRDRDSARRQPVDIPARVPSGRHWTFRGTTGAPETLIVGRHVVAMQKRR
jgi:hypothetical protein